MQQKPQSPAIVRIFLEITKLLFSVLAVPWADPWDCVFIRDWAASAFPQVCLPSGVQASPLMISYLEV